jgi:hypothetical protein
VARFSARRSSRVPPRVQIAQSQSHPRTLGFQRSALVWRTGLVWRLELALERRELEALRGPHEAPTSPFHSDVASETDGEGTASSFPNEGSPLSLPFIRSAVWYNGWPAPRPIVVDVEASLEADQ